MVDRIINTKKLETANTVIVSAPFENSVSFMGGTEKGPEKIVDCLDNNLELFDIDLLREPAKEIKTAHVIIDSLNKLSPKDAVEKIYSEYKKINSKTFKILLGGEHTVSLGALKVIAENENPKDITILQIDAHQDLRDDNSDYNENSNKFAHSCVMRRAHELGYNLMQVGIRTFSKYEYEYWQKNKKTITVIECKNKMPSVNKIIKKIKTKKVYLSIDVDGFDPAFMPGTGTPVQGGLDWHYGLDLIQSVVAKKNVLSADIVEVSPQKDSVITEFGAALICYKILSKKFCSK